MIQCKGCDWKCTMDNGTKRIHEETLHDLGCTCNGEKAKVEEVKE